MMIERAGWRRAALAVAGVLVMVLVPAAGFAGSSSTTLPNGAQLTVSVDDPVTSTEFAVPPDESSIDVQVSGTASVGLGEPDATFVYAMDVSGSTDVGSGTGCAPILDCEQEFIKALNQAVVADGSADEAGVVVFATTAATADMAPDPGDQALIEPDAPGVAPLYVDTVVDSTFSVLGGNGGVAQFTNKVVGVQTNCTAGLQAMLTLFNVATNSTKIGLLVSDGLCDDSGGGGLGAFNAAIAALAAAGATVHTVAAGTGSSCDGHEPGFDGTLQDIADGTGGECFEREDPGLLPEIIPSLIGSTLESLEIEVDGTGAQPIPNADISLPLPQPGAVSVNYSTSVMGVGPGDHEICVSATGSDVTGGTATVTRCETIHLLKLTAAPAEETNELGVDDEHTVTATILGDPAQVAGRPVTFVVSGQNAGAVGTCSPNADCTTDAAGQVSFTYSVPVAPSSLGTDTITVSTVIAGATSSVDVVKHWVDTTPPEAACSPTTNPSGRTVPPAGTNPSSGQNPDGFYELTAIDLVDGDVQIFIHDGGSSAVFGPFATGTKIKLTQAPGATPTQRPGPGVIDWHIKLKGDAELFAVDSAGNVAGPIDCLVPPPPK